MTSSRPTPNIDRATGTWQFRFDSVQPNPDGSRRRIHRSGFTTRAEAAAAMTREIAQDNAAIMTQQPVTVAEVLDEFLSAQQPFRRLRQHTLRQYEWAVDEAKTMWGSQHADALTTEEVNRTYQDLATPFAPHVMYLIHGVLRAAYAQAVDAGRVPVNPFLSAASRPARPLVEHSLSPEQLAALVDHANSRHDIPTGLFEVFISTGLRPGELVALRWSDLDTNADTLTVRRCFPGNGKPDIWTVSNGSARTIDLDGDAVEALARRSDAIADRHHRERGPVPGITDDLVFTQPDGQALTPRRLSEWFAQLCEQIGAPRVSIFSSRRALVRAARDHGMDRP